MIISQTDDFEILTRGTDNHTYKPYDFYRIGDTLPLDLTLVFKFEITDCSQPLFDNICKELALIKGLNTVMISDSTLDKLPDSFRDLNIKRVEFLNTRKFDLDNIFYQISFLKKLQEVRFIGCQVNSFPPLLEELKKLRVFHLEMNPQTDLNTLFIRLQKLPKLEVLRLESCEISVLPASIQQVNQLKGLWLGNNRLTILPNEITLLRNLRLLDLGENEFRKIPDVVFLFPKMRMLHLGCNYLPLIEIKRLNKLNLGTGILTIECNLLDDDEVSLVGSTMRPAAKFHYSNNKCDFCRNKKF